MFEYRSFKNFDTTSFNEDLRNVPWHVVENGNNINDALLTWNKLFSEVADDHGPVKRRVKGISLPWRNRKISDERTSLVSSKSTKIELSQTLEHLWETEEQGKLNRLVKSAETKYYCDMIN